MAGTYPGSVFFARPQTKFTDPMLRDMSEGRSIISSWPQPRHASNIAFVDVAAERKSGSSELSSCLFDLHDPQHVSRLNECLMSCDAAMIQRIEWTARRMAAGGTLGTGCSIRDIMHEKPQGYERLMRIYDAHSENHSGYWQDYYQHDPLNL